MKDGESIATAGRRALIGRLAVAAVIAGVTMGQPPRAHGGDDGLLEPWQRRQKAAVAGNLERPEFDAMRKPERAETFVLDWSTSAKAHVEASRPTPLSAELARAMAELLLMPGSLEPATSLCEFEPAIAIRFHQARESERLAGGAVDAQVCFKCRELAFQTVGEHDGPFVLNGRFLYSFEAVKGRLLELSQKARPADARLAEVGPQWDAEAQASRRYQEAKRAFFEALPSPLKPLWGGLERTAVIGPDRVSTAAWRAALASDPALPTPKAQILALMGLYGSGAGSWNSGASYEFIAEKLLLSYPAMELFEAAASPSLSAGQLEGAARLFAGRSFQAGRREDAAMLRRTPLRKKLLDHWLKDGDPRKRERASAVFNAP